MKKLVRATALLMTGLILSGCTAQEATEPVVQTKLVKYEEIKPTASGDSIALSGNVVPVEKSSVSFKQAGVIEQVYVKEGDVVKKGDKLASLKTSDYELKLKAAQAQSMGAAAQADTAGAGVSAAQAQAEAAMAQVKTAKAAMEAAQAQVETAEIQIATELPSKIAQAKEQLDLTTTNYESIKTMYDNGAIAKNKLDEITTKLNVDKQTYQQALDAKKVAESKLNAAKAQVEASRATMETAQATYNAALEQINASTSTKNAANAQSEAAKAQTQAAVDSLKDTVIYSPIDGVVLKKVMNSGETTGAGTPIVVIGTTDKMWISVGVPDNYINKVQKGQKALINVYGLNDVVEGVVDEIGALADTTTRTFNVNIVADNSKGLLKAGMICNTDIIFSGDDRVLVPVDSVISLPEGDSVYTVEGDTVKKVAVKTGEIKGDKIEVTEGLDIGDKLVVEGQFVLDEGESVKAEVKMYD